MWSFIGKKKKVNKTQKWILAHSQGFIAQGEMGDTSELCKSEDSLPRQTHTHTQWPWWSVNWPNDVQRDLLLETRLVFAYGKNNNLHMLRAVCVSEALITVLLSVVPPLWYRAAIGFCWHDVYRSDCTAPTNSTRKSWDKQVSQQCCCEATKQLCNKRDT